MYKLFYFDNSPQVQRYVAVHGVWRSVAAFLRFLEKRGFAIPDGLANANWIRCPFYCHRLPSKYHAKCSTIQ